MLFTTITAALLSSAAFAAALPTTDTNNVALPATGTLERRACTTKYPTHVFQIREDDPTHNTGDHSYVYTAQEAGKTHQWVTELQFANVPRDASGCSVELFFQKGYRQLTTSGGDAQNPTRLEVFAADRAVSLADTWLNHPGKAYSVGTQIVTASELQDSKLTLVTGSCQETLNYLIEIQGDRAGSICFSQSEPNGLRLTYNC